MNIQSQSSNAGYRNIAVYKFSIFAVEDPELSASQILSEWKHSPMGNFVISKSLNKPTYNYYLNNSKMSYEFVITADLKEKHISEYYLRWGNFLKGQK